MAISCSGKKCSIVSVIFLVASVAVLWLVWFGTASLLGKDVVGGGLQQLSAQLARFGDVHGKDVKLTYGEIDIEGWGYKKQAVVHDVVIQVANKSAMGTGRLSFSVEDVEIVSDPVDYKRLVISLSKPINISRDGRASGVLSFSEPLTDYYTQAKIGDDDAFRHDMIFPKEMTLSKQSGEAVAEQIFINFAKAPTLIVGSIPAQKSRSVSYDFSGFTQTSPDKNKINIGSLVGQLTESLSADGKLDSKYTLAVSDFVWYGDKISTKPYALNIDAVFSRPSDEKEAAEALPADTAASSVSAAPDGGKILLNSVVLSSPDFNLRASGNVSRASSDPLPSGEVNVDIDNLSGFLASEFVAIQDMAMMEAALVKITGQPLAGQTSVSIPLKREKNGVFYIGKTTFEGLVASLLSASIVPNQSLEALPVDGAAVQRLPEIAPALGKQPDDSVFGKPSSQPNGQSEGEVSVELPVTAPKQ